MRVDEDTLKLLTRRRAILIIDIGKRQKNNIKKKRTIARGVKSITITFSLTQHHDLEDKETMIGKQGKSQN